MINYLNKTDKFNECILIFISSTILIRPISTVLIFVFVIGNLINYKNLKLDKKIIKGFLFLMIPIFLEILFIWNNTPINKGFKGLEKVLSFFIFPFFICINYKKYNFFNVIYYYRYIFTLVLFFVLIRFAILKPDFVLKYFEGVELWEMGYVIADSFGSHAPSVNMHVAFLIMANIYILLYRKEKRIISALLLVSSIIILFIFNTRASLGTSILGAIIIFSVYAYEQYKKRFLLVFTIFLLIVTTIVSVAFYSNPYMKEKYSKVTFANMDKIGKLDEVDNPEGVLHNALVTRITMWKSSIELSKEKLFIGFGSINDKQALLDYYKRTDQKFLLKHKFPVHNQFFDYLLKFGLLGFLGLIYFFIQNFKIAIFSKNILLFVFIINFLLSNLVDDFLISFDGIVFSAIWLSLGYAYYLKKNCNNQVVFEN
ncbi:O-antigen ligase family protein [Empedobacter tilapiae]